MSPRGTAASIAIVMVLAAGCSEGEASAGAAERFRAAMDAVCQGHTFAEQREYRASFDVFQGGAHAYLHRLADQVELEDRAVAEDLFQAKLQVEETFRNPPLFGPEMMGRRFAALEGAMREAASVVGLPEVQCSA